MPKIRTFIDDEMKNPLKDALLRAAEEEKRRDKSRKRRRSVLTARQLCLILYTQEALTRITDRFARKVVRELADALDWVMHGALPKGAEGRRPGAIIETTADLLAPLRARYMYDLDKLGQHQSLEVLKRRYLNEARGFLRAKGKLLRVKGKKEVEVSERTLRQALFGGTRLQ